MVMWIKNPNGNVGTLAVTDDGTNIVFTYGGVDQFKVRKSDRQMLFDAGATDDSF